MEAPTGVALASAGAFSFPKLYHSNKVLYLYRKCKAMNYGQTIKELRLKKGMKQKELAKTLGMLPNQLSQIENGHKEPGKEMLKRLAAVLDVPAPIIIWKATTEEDVPEEKREAFNAFKGPLDALLSETFG